MLYIKKIIDKAIIPKKGTPTAAGYDLFCVEEQVIAPKGKGLVKTGISIACPPGSYARIAPRSGLALKNFIDVGAGVIDEDYRGEIGVLLFNFGDVEFKVNYGDRIAQMIIEYVVPTEIVETDNLTLTQRGSGGFGSTGVSLNHIKTKFQYDPEYAWKEKTILTLYTLFQENKISAEQKQKLGQLTFQGDKRIYEVIQQNPENLLEFLAAID